MPVIYQLQLPPTGLHKIFVEYVTSLQTFLTNVNCGFSHTVKAKQYVYPIHIREGNRGPGIRGTQVKSSVEAHSSY
jgi:hypothetical protein